ncbi:MAG: NAD-dependent epimerase/dehydratase family protein [Microbacteriaceae bacterium]|nr:NAD-dependent epimerase/dehydratase family protein [Microbacteriaceae bacterium]
MTAKTDLGSSHVFLTGGTGFVGQAIVERLLSSQPGTIIHLLIRPKRGVTPEARLRTLLKKPVFTTWRERVGEAEVEKAVAGRLRVIEGDMGAIPPMPREIDIVIHSASAVTFDPPIDQAFDTNLGGAMALYESIRAGGGDPLVVHVSTCYVGGIRKGVVPEARLTHDVDWRAEYAAAKDSRVRVEMESRQPETLSSMMDAARAVHGKEGPQAVAKAAEISRVEWVRSRLVDYGRARAESLGWTDVYTLTKAFAERAAEELWGGEHRLSVVRPSIIESSLKHPYPGWIDGFKVADPLILAYGRGVLPQFPGLPDTVLDVIPVDYVVNAILAVAANPAKKGTPDYFHVSSGAGNPLPIHRMFDNMNVFFKANPIPHESEGHVRVPTWNFPGYTQVARAIGNEERKNDRREKRLERRSSNAANRAKMGEVLRRRSDLETLRNFSELYRAYVQTEIIFDDRNTKALNDSLPAKVRADLGFDVTAIDWENYLQQVHFPSITGMTRAFAVRSSPTGGAAEKALPERTDVLAVFDFEGTVVDSNIVQQYLWVRSAGFRKAAWPGEVAGLLTSLPRYLRAERRDRGEFIRAFLRRYSGMPARRLEAVVSGGYKEVLLRHTMSAAVDRIRAHRAAGHRTVLVTGSIATLTEPLASLFDDIIGGSMHEKDGVLTGYLAQPPLVDEARAAWLTRYAEIHGMDLSQSYGYGDSHADLVWLELLGNPTAVSPDTHLSREALRRRWSIRDWKREGRGIGSIEFPVAEPLAAASSKG